MLRRFRPALALSLVLTVAGCIGGTLPGSAPPVTSGAGTPGSSSSASPPPSPAASPVPTASDVAEPTPPGQTETEFGLIWDALPASFPTFPGSSTTETGTEIVSGSFVVPDDPSTVAIFLQGAMEQARFSTEALSGPLEGGQFVLLSVGPGSTDCRVETTVSPGGDGSLVWVRYGAACPFD